MFFSLSLSRANYGRERVIDPTHPANAVTTSLNGIRFSILTKVQKSGIIKITFGRSPRRSERVKPALLHPCILQYVNDEDFQYLSVGDSLLLSPVSFFARAPLTRARARAPLN